MHIPDGYLGPQTYLTSFAIMAPAWAWASSRLKRTLRVRQVPLLALGAAFTFVVMMFNVPIPGGTTGHAVGGVLVAILLGPWAALVAVSVALAVQALLFGDGGVTAFGANCLTMGLVMPWVGWWTYRLLAGRSSPSSRRRWVAAAVAGYAGLNAAALLTAVLFGIQPALAHDGAGRALYCPFGLGLSIPAMALEHLLLFGVVEAVATGSVVSYLGRTEPSLLAPENPSPGTEAPPFPWKRLSVGLAVLILLCPLGLYLPSLFGAGDAWGEWGAEGLEKLAGFVPAGLMKLEGLWGAPMPDYAPPSGGDATLPVLSLWYILSGLLGASLVAALLWGARFVLAKREGDASDS